MAKKRYGGLKVQNRVFVLTPPQSHKSLSLGMTPFEFRDERDNFKTRVFGLSVGEEMTL